VAAADRAQPVRRRDERVPAYSSRDEDWEVPQLPEWGEANKPKAIDFLGLLDAELAMREFAAGDDFSIADVTGLVALDFMKPARIAVPETLTNVLRWHRALAARPSAAA